MPRVIATQGITARRSFVSSSFERRVEGNT
jgi:hypothetical protein